MIMTVSMPFKGVQEVKRKHLIPFEKYCNSFSSLSSTNAIVLTGYIENLVNYLLNTMKYQKCAKHRAQIMYCMTNEGKAGINCA